MDLQKLLDKHGRPPGSAETEEQREFVATKTFIGFIERASKGEIREGRFVRNGLEDLCRLWRERGQVVPKEAAKIYAHFFARPTPAAEEPKLVDKGAKAKG